MQGIHIRPPTHTDQNSQSVQIIVNDPQQQVDWSHLRYFSIRMNMNEFLELSLQAASIVIILVNNSVCVKREYSPCHQRPTSTWSRLIAVVRAM